jgi:hypothetical protein
MPVTTRSKKQKIDDDRSPLWKFVTDHPLVFGAEVLTKLNEFDLKIFYDLCRASSYSIEYRIEQRETICSESKINARVGVSVG